MVNHAINNNTTNKIHDITRRNHELWELFSKKEEYNSIKLDEHKRFSYSLSKHRNVMYPSVSEHLIKQGFNAVYPEDKQFAIILTHDVDDIYVKLRHILLSIAYWSKNWDFSSTLHLTKGLFNKSKTPYKNFRKIIQLEKKYDAKSSFYFLTSPNDIFGTKYELDDLHDEIGFLIDEDFEIGLHTGYHSYDNFEKIKKEKEMLEKMIGKKIIGARNHVLRFKTPQSWEQLSKAGLLYDTTFGYHDHIGFRNGMCHPFRPYNLNSEKTIDILEIPLIIEDMTFIMYMKENVRVCWDYIKGLIDTVKELNGVITILWHTWTFSYPVSYGGMFGKEWNDLYEKILEYGQKKNAWITNCKELYEYNASNGILKSTNS